MLPLSNASTASTSGFHADFFSASMLPLPAAVAAAPAIRYSPDHHGSFEQFRLSEDFQRANECVRADVGALVAFIDAHEPARGDWVRQQFDIFLENLDAGAFSRLDELLYRYGLPALHEATQLVSGDSTVNCTPMALQDKVQAVLRLADGVTVCAPGVTSNLASAARDLALGTGRLREKIWQAKEQAVAQQLQMRVSDWYRDRVSQLRDELALFQPGAEAALQQFHANNEIHLVNDLWNEMADQLGLPRKDDPLRVAMPFDQSIREVEKSEWRESIRNSLKPSAIAMTIAEEMLRAYKEDVLQAGLPLKGPRDSGLEKALAATGRATSERFGLPASEALNLYNLVAFEGANYRVMKDAAPLAVEILARMDKLGLISGQPQNKGHWTEQPSGSDYTLFVYEELAWKVEGCGHALQGMAWTDAGRWSALPVILKDLRDWSEANANASASAGAPAIPPQGALRHVIGKTLPDVCLHEIPASWVTDQTTHQALRDRLGLGLSAYATYIEHRWPAQLTALVNECVRNRVTLPTLFRSYEQQPGVKVLPPRRLVLACQDLTYADPCVAVLKHWPPDADIDFRLKLCLGSSAGSRLEFAGFQLARRAYLFTHRRSIPQEWPKPPGSTKRKP